MPLSSQNLVSDKDSNLVLIAPDIPINVDDAFFPLKRDPSDDKIYPSYQWRECAKRFIWCTEWKAKTVYFKDLEWFLIKDMGLKMRTKPSR